MGDDNEVIFGGLHRPLVKSEIDNIHPQAVVDKSEVPASFEHKMEVEPVFEKFPENVQLLDVNTSHDIPPARCLQAAYEAGLVEVVIAGVDKDGRMFLARSAADMATSVFHVQRAMHTLMQELDEIERTEIPSGPTRA